MSSWEKRLESRKRRYGDWQGGDIFGDDWDREVIIEGASVDTGAWHQGWS